VAVMGDLRDADLSGFTDALGSLLDEASARYAAASA